jgi:ABC-2 type transport system permease protein
VILGSAFFSCLSMSSNALYPEQVMPGWLQAISKVNPLSYEVDALRGLLIGTEAHLALDAAVLVFATAAGVTVSALLLPRLAR